MNQATFTEICKLMKDKNYELHECMKGIFQTALLFFPGLICKETAFIVNIANGVSLLEAKEEIGKSIKTLVDTFSHKSYQDFTTKYEHARIAHVLLVYSAYFDSIKMYLPDKAGTIRLSGREKIVLTEKSIEKYLHLLTSKANVEMGTNAQYIFEQDLSLPNPVENILHYEEELKRFYEILNREFMFFYEQLLVWEKMEESEKDHCRAILIKLPEMAVKNYRKQYYQLAASFQDFFVWATLREHEQLEQKIDIGFAGLTERLFTYQEKNLHTRACSTLENYHKKYCRFIEDPLIDTADMDYNSADNLIFPAKRDIFVPQNFKALVYRNHLPLEAPETWKDCKEGTSIGKFIGDVLRHPVTGSLPLLILGHPGAGKSLLCHMLAARILFHEYHVILVKLRDTVADQTIRQQINQQIERDFANGCTWDEIVESGLQKPLLIIFDGYDELLQASGKTYSNYLQNIAEFQREEKNYHNIFVKCIVTSRTTLIDKALIINRSPVIMLSDFDETAIDQWSRIWNAHNQSYFAEHGLKPFTVEKTGKIYELASQPLLLLMLALYDSDDNALRKNGEMNSTRLYDSLIREFIAREKRKSEAFRNKQHNSQEEILELELKKISIAALGMYNRKALYIRAEELEKDLKFLLEEETAVHTLQESELTESDKLLGSFFFIHRSDSVEMVSREKRRTSAYEFLHNTFGEFLTAHYIVDTTYQLLQLIQFLIQGRQQSLWNPEKQKSWIICLSYAPLFSRPVVVRMIHEWSYSYLQSKSISKKNIEMAFDFLIDSEIKRIISGDTVFTLKKMLDEKENPYRQKELLEHLALYALNLIILRVIIHRKKYCFPLDQDIWNKLVSLWKYAFSEDTLLDFSRLFQTKRTAEGYHLKYKEIETAAYQRAEQDRLANLADINAVLCDECMSGVLDSLTGINTSGQVFELLERNCLKTTARFWWNHLLTSFTCNELNQESLFDNLTRLYKYCLNEEDIQYLFSFYLLFHFLLKAQLIKTDNRTNDLLLRCIINGISSQESDRCSYAPTPYIRTIPYFIGLLAVALIDYIIPDTARIELIFKTCTLVHPLNRDSSESFLYSNGNLYCQVLKKMIARPENISIIKAKSAHGYIQASTYLSQFIIATDNGRLHLNATTIFINLEIACYLLPLGYIPESSSLFTRCLQLLRPENFNQTPSVPRFLKILLIDYLYQMYWQNALSRDKIGQALENLIQKADIQQLFNASPETVGHLLFLLDIRMFLNREKICKDLLSLVKYNRERIPVGVYRQISLFARKSECQELLALVEGKNDETVR